MTRAGRGATADGIGHGLLWATLIMLGSSMAIRAVIVGRGPWGNMYEFSIAFATGIILAYLLLQRRYPIRSIAFVPAAIALALVGYAADAAVRRSSRSSPRSRTRRC